MLTPRPYPLPPMITPLQHHQTPLEDPVEEQDQFHPSEVDLGLDLTSLTRSPTLTSIYEEEYDNASYEHDEGEVDLGVEGTTALEDGVEESEVCMKRDDLEF
ncbi:uncharacterized protein [Diadema setosum]|uniref:uncharacterized protein n=1 Tax=Diadema setosum TaxID=31175 RepID=UPI003B3A6AA9